MAHPDPEHVVGTYGLRHSPECQIACYMVRILSRVSVRTLLFGTGFRKLDIAMPPPVVAGIQWGRL